MEEPAVLGAIVRDQRVVWEVAGKPVSVRVTRDVVDRLGLAVGEGFKAPRRGLETGGLLIGTKTKVAGQIVVDVDDFEAVESEHAAGPSYLLSDADRRLLGARIGARGKSVVGFYRSHTRNGMSITMEDTYLFSMYFRKASDVFLLIKSNEDGPPSGGFIIREGGKILAYSPYLQFPFTPAIFPEPVRQIAAPTAVAAVAELVPVQAEPVVIVAPPRRTRMIRRPVRVLTLGAVALAVGIAFAIGTLVPRSTTAKTSPRLALNVANIGNRLRLSWDRHALLQASSGILWIQDGQAEQSIELDNTQLREGTIAYWPKSRDVNFRLQLRAPGGTSTESIRAIGQPPDPPSQPSPPAEAVASTPPAPEPVSAQKPVWRRIRPAKPPSQTYAAFQPPPSADPPARAVSLPDAPVTQASAFRPARELNEMLPPTASPSVPHERETGDSFRITAEAVPASRLERFARRIPLVGRRYKKSDYVPPKLSNSTVVNPLRSAVTRDINIDVKVYVSPAGTVDYSELLSSMPPADRDLAATVVFSARQCRFVPARDGDEAAPGEVILHYQFSAAARVAGNQASGTR